MTRLKLLGMLSTSYHMPFPAVGLSTKAARAAIASCRQAISWCP